MVDSASRDWTTPITIIPMTGAPILFTLVKKAGNIFSSAADLPVIAMVNCQPSSEPRQASTASAMTMDPMVGLNILAKARAKGPVDSASSAFGTIPWITVVDRM